MAGRATSAHVTSRPVLPESDNSVVIGNTLDLRGMTTTS